jgi:hypothetical protein
LAATDPNPGHLISLQAAWEPPSAGIPEWRRSFGRPVDLPAGERVSLVVVAPSPVLETLTLNGRPVAFRGLSADGTECVRGCGDVTADLAARNELRLPGGGAAGATMPSRRAILPDTVARVWLEIRPAPTPDHP